MRRWIDKALVGAIGLVIAIIGVVYSTVRADIARLQEHEQGRNERLRAVEVLMDDTRQAVDRVEKKLDKILERGTK